MKALSFLTPWCSKAKAAPPLQVKLQSGAPPRSENYARRRILNELTRGNEDPATHCSYGMIGNDMFNCQGIIMGPSETPFEGGVFYLSIEFTPEYPFRPPKIKFLTKVYHPNISRDGTIHVDILGKQWSPALGIEQMLLSICSLLPDPNAEGSHNPICNLYRNDRKSYNQKAREWTVKYAMG